MKKRRNFSESHHQILAGVKSFTEQKGSLTWKKYWTALRLGAHFLSCSHCEKYPLFTGRYDCINCANYTLCLDCEKAQVHPKTHILALMNYPVITKFYFQWNQPLVFTITCSHCGVTPVTGTIYNNFQTQTKICSQCYPKIESSKDWYEQKIPDFELFPEGLLGQNYRGAFCDICGVPSIPVNWKCTCCYDYDLCNTCIEAKKHTKKHAIMKLYWSKWNRGCLSYLKPGKRWKDADDKDESDYEDLVLDD